MTLKFGETVSPLQELVRRCQLASERMGLTNPNRQLLADLAMAVVSLARLNADLLAKDAERSSVIVTDADVSALTQRAIEMVTRI